MFFNVWPKRKFSYTNFENLNSSTVCSFQNTMFSFLNICFKLNNYSPEM